MFTKATILAATVGLIAGGALAMGPAQAAPAGQPAVTPASMSSSADDDMLSYGFDNGQACEDTIVDEGMEDCACKRKTVQGRTMYFIVDNSTNMIIDYETNETTQYNISTRVTNNTNSNNRTDKSNKNTAGVSDSGNSNNTNTQIVNVEQEQKGMLGHLGMAGDQLLGPLGGLGGQQQQKPCRTCGNW